ncbi:MAG: hypothetical protein RL375_2334, partial [Pseudomonadota bacterium]
MNALSTAKPLTWRVGLVGYG